MTNVVEIRDLSKHFSISKDKSLKERIVNFGRGKAFREEFWALRDVSLDIASGTTVGLVGPNGSGKSTLLKMIGGILQPDTGTVDIRGRLAALLELGAGFHPDLTGRENVFLNAAILGLSRAETEKHFDAIVDFSGIERFIDTQVKFYSSGMYVRLAFAVAVHVDPDILLVDEVLAVGDLPFQQKCMDRIRQLQHDGRTIVFVSHSLDQVAELCDRAVVLEAGTVIADDVPADSLKVLREEFDQRRAADLEKQLAAAAAARARLGGAEGADWPRIESVELLGPDGAPVRQVGPQADVTIAVTIDAPRPTDRLSLTGGISNALGVTAYATNTEIQQASLPTISGRTRIDFTLADLRLVEGNYSLFAALDAHDGAQLDQRRDQTPFVVTGDHKQGGFTWARAQVSVAQA